MQLKAADSEGVRWDLWLILYDHITMQNPA